MKKIFVTGVLTLVVLSVFAQLPESFIRQIVQNKSGLSTLDFTITAQHTNPRTGVTHVYMRQKLNGFEVYNVNPSIHFDKSRNVVAFHNKFVNTPADKSYPTAPVVSYMTALQNAASHVEAALPVTLNKQVKAAADGKYILSETTPVSAKTYYYAADGGIRLAWNIELYDNETHNWWHIQVDAETGVILDKNNWTTQCSVDEVEQRVGSFNQHAQSHILMTQVANKAAKKTSDGSYSIFPRPFESPNHGSRSTVSGSATSNASPFGWHDTDGVAGADFTITRGNNVFAREDRANTNSAGFSPDGGSGLVFDFPYHVDSSANSNQAAAITNLFYWNNLIHDIFYNYGFDEESGNFQANNYSKGGADGDAVFADAQDGSGTNNANFQTPVDGTSGRMQMYLWYPSTTGIGTQNLRINNTTLAGWVTSPFGNLSTRPADTITAQLVLVNDSSTNPTHACNSIKNDIAGKIALIDRGTSACNYRTKILNAQAAGAIAVVMVNTQNSAVAMTGNGNGINIPGVMISSSLGTNLKTKLNQDSTVFVSIRGNPQVSRVYDSDFDNGVITHEYGHGISTRLTGGPANSSCLNNQEQMGEGWSDFFALCLTASASDSALDGKGIGTYVFNQTTDGLGIRNYKYSRSLSVNPTTYNSIKTLSVPHGVGSVWCAMLYDMYWDMVDKYGFNENIYQPEVGGNNMALQLVIDALKLQPCNPGFEDGRNAILLADSLRNGGANKELIWRAFARRGLGLSADQGLTSSRSDGTEAFDLPKFGPNTSVMKTKAWETVRVLPNPAKDLVQIALPDYVTGVNVSVVDITGKQVLNTTLQVNTGKTILNMSSLNRGVYILRISDGTHAYQTKLVLAE